MIYRTIYTAENNLNTVDDPPPPPPKRTNHTIPQNTSKPVCMYVFTAMNPNTA